MKLKQIKLALGASALAMALSACAQHGMHKKDYQFAKANSAKLQSVVAARSDDAKQRDAWRKPAETLEFFRVEPGMTVVEALPGGGWYTKIIADYVGSNGALYGINYDDDMWPKFGFFSEERIKELIESNAKFPETVAKVSDSSIKARGFTFSTAPDELAGTVDRVLVIRAMHNLNRFEKDGQYRSKAIAAMHKLLKTGGMVGVVQHKVAEESSDEGAQGQRGYLKESAVIKMFEQAGFKLVAKSDMHANPKDQPSATDVVWRLAPTFATSRENPELKAKLAEIGESNRMTLLFKKI
ncbi:MAG: class I SAM-dependent methyltransferase [Gammaproteobacteria bacterium]|nr:class I SAM-dependent methyltransferase [Gammaproteobacteria bacterium]